MAAVNDPQPNDPQLPDAEHAELNSPPSLPSAIAALVARFGENIQGAGYRIYTTVDSAIQNAAVDAVISGLMAYDRRHGWRGACT